MSIIYMNNEWSDDEDYDEYECEDYTKKNIINIYTIEHINLINIHTIDPVKKHNIFLIVEKLFKDEIASYPNEYIISTSICYNVQQKNLLIALGDKINKVFPYNILGNYDLYLTLIFTYHSLLEEPGEEIFTGFFNRYAYNYTLVIELYFKLTTGDLFADNGDNLSRDVRRKILGLL